MNIFSSKPKSADITESISVVLRRQVPIRHDETARSWLGGLPSLPDDVEWPRSIAHEYPEAGERPLHFVMQICCADLPAALWGGLGPRTGWLIIFVDPNQGWSEGDGGHRVIHTTQIGVQRAPPSDIGPVHDGNYTGGNYKWLETKDVPPIWRRWPVDIVSYPNAMHARDTYNFGSPPDFDMIMYDGAPVDREYEIKGIKPYRYGQALKSVRELAETMSREPRPVIDRKSTRLNSSHRNTSRMPSSA